VYPDILVYVVKTALICLQWREVFADLLITTGFGVLELGYKENILRAGVDNQYMTM
jgi:hypothetical protein